MFNHAEVVMARKQSIGNQVRLGQSECKKDQKELRPWHCYSPRFHRSARVQRRKVSRAGMRKQTKVERVDTGTMHIAATFIARRT